MSEENKTEITKVSLYDRAVEKITERFKPYLHRVTQGFVTRSVETYAKDNPQLARMIEFEVRRRGDGPGLTQDVAEPLLWVGVKTLAALAIAIPLELIKHKGVKAIERIAMLGIVLNNGVELFRLIPRYKAGLEGSLEMAKDRWRSLEETGVDPFSNQQQRQISVGGKPDAGFAHTVQKKSPVVPTSLTQQAEKASQPTAPVR